MRYNKNIYKSENEGFFMKERIARHVDEFFKHPTTLTGLQKKEYERLLREGEKDDPKIAQGLRDQLIKDSLGKYIEGSRARPGAQAHFGTILKQFDPQNVRDLFDFKDRELPILLDKSAKKSTASEKSNEEKSYDLYKGV